MTGHTIVVLAILLPLTGCAIGVFDPYREPAGGSVATLYIDKKDHVAMGFYGDTECKLGKHGTYVSDLINTKKPESKTVSSVLKGYKPDSVQANTITSIKIPAGEKLFIAYYFADEKGRKCLPTISFTPDADGKYLSDFSTSETGCRAVVIDLKATSDIKRPSKPADLMRNEKDCNLYKNVHFKHW